LGKVRGAEKTPFMVLLPKQRRDEEEDPERRSQNQWDPENSDFAFAESVLVLDIGPSRLEDPLGVAGLVDAVPPTKADL